VSPENEPSVVSRREALSSQYHIETVRAPCEQAPIVEGGSPVANLACGPYAEDTDVAAFSPEAIEALRHADERRVASPYTAVDQTMRLYPVGGEKGWGSSGS